LFTFYVIYLSRPLPGINDWRMVKFTDNRVNSKTVLICVLINYSLVACGMWQRWCVEFLSFNSSKESWKMNNPMLMTTTAIFTWMKLKFKQSEISWISRTHNGSSDKKWKQSVWNWNQYPNKPNKIMNGTSQATLTMYTPGDKEWQTLVD